MVSTAIFTLPPSSPVSPSTNLIRAASIHNPIFCKFNFIHFCRNPLSLRPKSVVELFFKFPNGYVGRHSICTSSSSKPFFRPVMDWQDCTVKMEVDVPVSVAYKCYSDREAMPKWMPFISSVKCFKLYEMVKPIPNQKIHWRSLEGLPNRIIDSPSWRRDEADREKLLSENLTVSYEVPQILVPVASALQPLLQSLLLRGLERCIVTQNLHNCGGLGD
ncbi:hypothetical protein Cgig2_030127 [Carnegiea gigantea]|uniref:Coenzyme Q-binding protein COQ10 START domain-containing protein n=1 Tax=Carnegiea gigantea TaxID=171969 RepID=A0A9Q1GIQ7_9CARY|nr:hypothetical protein Cgig2_030127 [Carnegiea gigantea]